MPALIKYRNIPHAFVILNRYPCMVQPFQTRLVPHNDQKKAAHEERPYDTRSTLSFNHDLIVIGLISVPEF